MKEKQWHSFKPDLLPSKSNASKSSSFLVFRDFVRTIEKSDLNYWVSCGTLLGLIRNGQLIPWDDDADFDFCDSKRELLFPLVKNLVEDGFIVVLRPGRFFTNINAFRDGFKCSLGKGVNLAGLFFTRSYKYPSRLIGNLQDNYKYFQEIKMNIRAPLKSEEYLSYVYGNWKVPIVSDYHGDYTRSRAMNSRLLLVILTIIDTIAVKRLSAKYVSEVKKLLFTT
jgi:hypothetical protein